MRLFLWLWYLTSGQSFHRESQSIFESLLLISSYSSQSHNQSITRIFSIWEFFGFQVTCILILYILQNKMKRNYRFPSLPSFIILHSITVLFIQLISFHYLTYFYDKISLLSSLLWLLILLVPLWSKEQQSKVFPSMPEVWEVRVFYPSYPQCRWSLSMRQHKDQLITSLWHNFQSTMSS